MSYILIVEDDVHLAQAVAQILSENGYKVDCSYDGDEGLRKAMTGAYDIVVLDIMLPGRHGYDVASELRKGGVDTPILMLTARSTVRDKVAGFDCGADDYMTKPFAPAELLAHLRAIERRSALDAGSADELEVGDLMLDLNSHELCSGGRKVALSAKEFSLAKMLIEEPGRAFSKDQILAKVWGVDTEAAENNVEAYISFLRKKLVFLRSETTLETLRKVGYRVVAGGDGEDGGDAA